MSRVFTLMELINRNLSSPIVQTEPGTSQFGLRWIYTDRSTNASAQITEVEMNNLAA